MDLEQIEELLPTTHRTANTDPKRLVYLMVAPPKWGKTTWFGDIPNSLLVAFERGYQFQTVPTVFIDAWDAKRDYEPYVDEAGVTHMTMQLLEKSLTVSDKYDFVTFDTADMAAKKCADYFCKLNGWQHPQDGGDYGKGYDITQNSPFRHMINGILATGRGIGFVTHSQVNTTAFKAGSKSKKETSLPGGIHKFLHSQADIIMHGSYGVKQKGRKYRDRILQTEGDEETLAGNRSRELNIPARYIVDPADPWKQWVRFFTDPTAGEEATRELATSIRNKVADKVEDIEQTDEPTAEPAAEPTPSKKRKAGM